MYTVYTVFGGFYCIPGGRHDNHEANLNSIAGGFENEDLDEAETVHKRKIKFCVVPFVRVLIRTVLYDHVNFHRLTVDWKVSLPSSDF
jgi:hypothetical protein